MLKLVMVAMIMFILLIKQQLLILKILKKGLSYEISIEIPH